RLVISRADEFPAPLLSILYGFAHIIDPRTGCQRRDSSHRETHIIRTPVQSFHWICVARDHSALSRHSLLRQSVQRAHAHSEDAEVLRPSPAPVAEVIQIDV